jgi:DNA-3-methyladenine glycosylase II
LSATIESLDDIATGIAALSARDPALARAYAESGMPALRRSPEGLASLCDIVIGQQVSVASARAIGARFSALFAPLDADRLALADDAAYRAAGLSQPKIRALRAIGEALRGGFDLAGLGALPADEAKAALCAIKGIGPWTADIYLLFALGHADAFAAGDLALQEALRLLEEREARPGAPELLARAESWRPWRGVAARVLWQYYRVRKGRAGL